MIVKMMSINIILEIFNYLTMLKTYSIVIFYNTDNCLKNNHR